MISYLKNHSPRPAFTLLEMVVMLAVISILSVIAVPYYSTALTDYRVTAAAKRVVADLLLAQNYAKVSSAGQTVTFSISNNNYQYSTYAGPLAELGQTTYTVRLKADPYYAALTSANFNSTTQLTYDRFGQPSSGGSVVVQVGTAQKTITVDANTGKASVQ